MCAANALIDAGCEDNSMTTFRRCQDEDFDLRSQTRQARQYVDCVERAIGFNSSGLQQLLIEEQQNSRRAGEADMRLCANTNEWTSQLDDHILDCYEFFRLFDAATFHHCLWKTVNSYFRDHADDEDMIFRNTRLFCRSRFDFKQEARFVPSCRH